MTKKKAILLSVLVLGVVTPLVALGISFLVVHTMTGKEVRQDRAREIPDPGADQAVSVPETAQTGGPDESAPSAAAGPAARVPKPEDTRAPSLPAAMNTRVIAGETTAVLSFSSEATLYDALVEARSEGALGFSGKQYPGLGFFVTDIGTLHSGEGKHLLYYINGTEATVGVSSYVLKDGDVIEWKLE